ncbi:TPA: hypothetical protein I0H40_RS14735 [Enterococcus faecalis]|nr:hypothetical protein [Enterococcus faecalis]
MRDFSLLDSAIDEMERVLLGNKPREAEEIYLQNAIDFIERFIKQLIEESKLNENQQIVLNRLENEGNAGSPIGAVSVMVDELEENLPLYYALASLKRKEHAQILRTFAERVIEQEEE